MPRFFSPLHTAQNGNFIMVLNHYEKDFSTTCLSQVFVNKQVIKNCIKISITLFLLHTVAKNKYSLSYNILDDMMNDKIFFFFLLLFMENII